MYQSFSTSDKELKTMGSIEKKADIALIGLAVMGQNLILNMNDHGFVVGCIARFCFEPFFINVHNDMHYYM